MATQYIPSAANYAAIKSAFESLLVNPVVGFSFVGNVVAEGITFSIYRRKSIYNSSGTDPKEYFYVYIGSNGSNIILGTCESADTSSFTNKPVNANLPSIVSVAFPTKVLLLANSNRVVIGTLDSLGVNQTIYVSSVNFSSLMQANINGNATHASNMKNNLQVFGKLGSSQRLLYAGNLTDGPEFDRGAAYNYLADSLTDLLNVQNGKAVVATVAVTSDADEYFGILDNLYISKSTVFHTFDRPVDSSGSFYRVFKDTTTATALIAKESA